MGIATTNGTATSNGNGHIRATITSWLLRAGYTASIGAITSLATWVWHSNAESQKTSDRMGVVEKQCDKTESAVNAHTAAIGEIKGKVIEIETHQKDEERSLTRIENKIDRVPKNEP